MTEAVGSLTPLWEIQMEFPAPGFALGESWPIVGIWGRGNVFLFPCVFVCLFVFQINKIDKEKMT